MQFTFNVIVKHVVGLTPEDPHTRRILEDFLTSMRGLISLPLYIPGTPYARAVQVYFYFLIILFIIGRKKIYYYYFGIWGNLLYRLEVGYPQLSKQL